MSILEQNIMNSLFVLAWLGLVIGIYMRIKLWRFHKFMQGPKGRLVELAAKVEGKTIEITGPHPIYNIWFFFSVAWLIAHYFIH